MTQTQVRSIPNAQEHDAMHNADGVCVWCATGPDWWAELRRKHGLSDPPYETLRLMAFYRRARRRGL